MLPKHSMLHGMRLYCVAFTKQEFRIRTGKLLMSGINWQNVMEVEKNQNVFCVRTEMKIEITLYSNVEPWIMSDLCL